jgi:hypothetical protein
MIDPEVPLLHFLHLGTANWAFLLAEGIVPAAGVGAFHSFTALFDAL